MRILAEICIIPIHGSTSLRNEIAVAHQILKDTGCTTQLHGYGTNVEGEFDTIMKAVQKIHETLHENGTVRIHTSMKISSRIDKIQTLQNKVDAVEHILGSPNESRH